MKPVERALLESEARIQRNVAAASRKDGLDDELVVAREQLADRLELMASAQPHRAFLDDLVRLAVQAFDLAWDEQSSELSHRTVFERHARERMAQAASVCTLDVAMGSSSLDSYALDEDTRRALPDADGALEADALRSAS